MAAIQPKQQNTRTSATCVRVSLYVPGVKKKGKSAIICIGFTKALAKAQTEIHQLYLLILIMTINDLDIFIIGNSMV